MQSNIIRASLALIAAATLITACSTHDDDTQPLDTPQTQTAQRTFTVSIPATFKGGASLTKALTIAGTDDAPTAIGSFKSTERVYVYNETKDAYLDGYLTPINISANGKSCTVAGSLTGNIEVDDNIKLIYNLNDIDYHFFDYTLQDGTPEGLVDGGVDYWVKVSSFENGQITIDEPAEIELQQSLFCFQFVDDNEQPIRVNNLRIESKKNDIISSLAPGYWDYDNDCIYLSLSKATQNKLYVSICIDYGYDDDVFNFTVFDADGNVFKGTKAAPEGGFQNGFFYYNSEPIKVEKQRNLHHPTITWTSVNPYSTIPNEYNYYTVQGAYNSTTHSYDPPVFTIGGESEGFGFSSIGTITFDKLNATLDYYDDPFLDGMGDLNIEIIGANEIDCSNYRYAILCLRVLKLSGEGTLKITCNENTGGLRGQGYSNDKCDPSVLAAEGYTVTRAKKDNGDNTYTYTYQVYKSGAGGDQGGDPNGPDDF